MKVWLIVIILLTASCSSTKHHREKYKPAKTQAIRVEQKKKNGVVLFHVLILIFFGLIEHFNKED